MTSTPARRPPARAVRPRGGPAEPVSRFAGLVSGPAAFGGLLVGAAVVTAVIGTAGTAEPRVAGISTPGPLVEFGLPVIRTLLDVSAVATAGLALLALLVGFDRPARTEPVLARARRLAVWTSGAWTVTALLAVVALTAELGPPTPGALWAYLTQVAAGKGLLLSAGCGLLSWWLARVSLRHGEKVPAELRVGLALFGLLPLPLTGHASTWAYHDISMIVMELHVVTASAWAGGLLAVVLFLAREPDLLAAALPKFSRLATWCVLVVGLTGVFTGLLELALSPISHLPGSLFSTRYGVLVVAKAMCLAAVALIAVRVRTSLMPQIALRRPTAFARWCGWELTVLAVAFAVAAVLTRTAVTPW